MVRRRKAVKKSNTGIIFILMILGSLISVISVYTASNYSLMFGFAVIGIGVLIASTEKED